VLAVDGDAGAVACGPDAVDAGRHVRIDREAPLRIERQAELLVQRAGPGARRPDRQAALDPLAIGERHSAGIQVGHRHAGVGLDLERAQCVLYYETCLGPEFRRHRPCLIDEAHRHVRYRSSGGAGGPAQLVGKLGGQLEAGEAGANDRGAERRAGTARQPGNGLAQGHGLLVAVDAVDALSALGQAHFASSAEHQLVIGELCRGVAHQSQPSPARVDPLDHCPAVLDPHWREHAAERDPDAAEIGLIETRPNDERVIGADEGDADPVLRPVAPQQSRGSHRRPDSGESAADNDDSFLPHTVKTTRRRKK
jgi:hypothetical protein